VVHRVVGVNYEEVVGGLNVWHVFVGDKCRTDYGDIRFTGGNNQELVYYLWPNFTEERARFSVKLNDANIDGVIQILYGDANTSSISSSETFVLHNDFDDQTIQGWQPSGSGVTLSVVKSGVNGSNCLQIQKTHSGYWGTDYCAAYKDITLPNGNYLLTLFINTYRHFEGDSYSTYYRIEYDETLLQDYRLPPTSSGHIVTFPITSDGQTSRLYIRGRAYFHTASAVVTVDDILIRVYSSNPPSAIALSGEQTNSNIHRQSVSFGSDSLMVV